MADQETALPIPSPVAAPVAPAPLIPSAGGLLPIPGDVTQTSSSTSSGYSGKVNTRGLREAEGQRRDADREMRTAQGLKIGAAGSEAESIRLDQEAKNATARKNLALQNIAAKEAEDTFIRAKQAESAAANRIRQQEEQYRKMDNQTFWGESKTWQKLLWGVSLAMGGYGSALSRGQNTPLLLLTRTIDDWGDRQAKRMDALSKDISDGKTALGSVAQEYAKREQELLPLRKAAAYGKIGDLAEQEVQKQVAAGNADAAARGQKLVADARAKWAEELQKAAKAEEQAQQFLAPTVEKGGRSGAINQAPSASMRRLSDKHVTEARKAIAAQQRIDKMYDALQAHLEKHGDLVLNPAERKARGQLVKNLVAELKGPDFFNLGASLTENEEAILNQASGGVDSTSVIDQLPRLLQGRDFVKNRQREKLAGLGVDAGDVDTALSMDPAKIGAPTEAGKAVREATGGKTPASKPDAPKLSPRDQEAVDWARANPQDPRAARILKANGL